jgi:hypothetical protein
MEMTLAPVVLFVYNRLWHTEQTITALQQNHLAEDSELFIFSDGPKQEKDSDVINEIRNYLQKINGFKKITIIERERNYGLAKSIISGVTEIIERYGKIIVLEDDLISSPSFLKYMNDALNFYQQNQKIFSITGYNYPSTLMKIPDNYNHDVYFSPRNGSQGWASWKNRWDLVDWEIKDYNEFTKNRNYQKHFNFGGDDLTEMLKSQMEGKIDSWSIRWCYAHYKNNALCVYPVKSFINNIGYDGSGIHCGKEIKNVFFNDALNLNNSISFISNVEIDNSIMVEFRKVFKKPESDKSSHFIRNFLSSFKTKIFQKRI